MFFLTAAGFRGSGAKHKEISLVIRRKCFSAFRAEEAAAVKLLLVSLTEGNHVLVKSLTAHFPKSAVGGGSGEEFYLQPTPSRPPAVLQTQTRPSVTFILLPSGLHPEQVSTSRNMSDAQRNTSDFGLSHTLAHTHVHGGTECV